MSEKELTIDEADFNRMLKDLDELQFDEKEFDFLILELTELTVVPRIIPAVPRINKR